MVYGKKIWKGIFQSLVSCCHVWGDGLLLKSSNRVRQKDNVLSEPVRD